MCISQGRYYKQIFFDFLKYCAALRISCYINSQGSRVEVLNFALYIQSALAGCQLKLGLSLCHTCRKICRIAEQIKHETGFQVQTVFVAVNVRRSICQTFTNNKHECFYSKHMIGQPALVCWQQHNFRTFTLLVASNMLGRRLSGNMCLAQKTVWPGTSLQTTKCMCRCGLGLSFVWQTANTALQRIFISQYVYKQAAKLITAL